MKVRYAKTQNKNAVSDTNFISTTLRENSGTHLPLSTWFYTFVTCSIFRHACAITGLSRCEKTTPKKRKDFFTKQVSILYFVLVSILFFFCCSAKLKLDDLEVYKKS